MTTQAVIDPEKRFFLHGGGELASLDDLFTELQTMEPQVYAHHVNEERNDFATWVRDVMGASRRTLSYHRRRTSSSSSSSSTSSGEASPERKRAQSRRKISSVSEESSRRDKGLTCRRCRRK